MKQLTYDVNYNTAFKRALQPDTTANTKQNVLDKKPLFTNSFSQNGKNVKYYSGIDAEIYFEDQYIDETVQLQFTVQQNVMPLTGYNSFVYDDVAVGARIVQGQFAINFTRAEYLYEILNTLQHKKIVKDSAIITDDEFSYTEKLEQNKAKANMTDNTLDPITQWRRSPLWAKGFNLVINYGNYLEHGQGGTLLVLDGVYLTGCAQGIGATGEPITEIYSFIARDIQFVPKAIQDAKPQVKPPENGAMSKTYGIKVMSATYYEEVTKVPKKNVSSFDPGEIYRNGGNIDDYLYETRNAPHLNTVFDFGDKTPLDIQAYVEIPVSTASPASALYSLDLHTMNKNTIDRVLDDQVMADMKEYQRVTNGVSASRSFNVYYTITFKDVNGQQNSTKITCQANVQK